MDTLEIKFFYGGAGRRFGDGGRIRPKFFFFKLWVSGLIECAGPLTLNRLTISTVI